MKKFCEKLGDSKKKCCLGAAYSLPPFDTPSMSYALRDCTICIVEIMYNYEIIIKFMLSNHVRDGAYKWTPRGRGGRGSEPCFGCAYEVVVKWFGFLAWFRVSRIL